PVEPHIRNRLYFYQAAPDIVKRMQEFDEMMKKEGRKGLPKNIYIAGGHSKNQEVRKHFTDAGYVVWGKEDFLSAKEVWEEKSDSLNHLKSALDYYVALKSNVFIGR